MTPAEIEQKIANLEAAVRAIVARRPATFLDIEGILARQPEPVAEPEKCCLGTVGCARVEAVDGGGPVHLSVTGCCSGYVAGDDGRCTARVWGGPRCNQPATAHRQPAAPEEPAPCPDGHVPTICGGPAFGSYRMRCYDDRGLHWEGPKADTPEAATREWNRGMRHG